jgi:hypothetical protein
MKHKLLHLLLGSMLAFYGCAGGAANPGGDTFTASSEISIPAITVVVICDLTHSQRGDSADIPQAVLDRANLSLDLEGGAGSRYAFIPVARDLNQAPILTILQEESFYDSATVARYLATKEEWRESLKKEIKNARHQEKDANRGNSCIEYAIDNAIEIFKSDTTTFRRLVIISDLQENCDHSLITNDQLSFSKPRDFLKAEEQVQSMEALSSLVGVKVWFAPMASESLEGSKALSNAKNLPQQTEIYEFWKEYLIKFGVDEKHIYRSVDKMPDQFAQ